MIGFLFGVLVYPGIAFMVLFSMVYYGGLRKLAARMQNRMGPPLLQPLYDVLKLFGKESIRPEQAKSGYTLWPLVAFAAAVTAGLMTPMAGITVLETTGGFLLLIYFLVMAAISVYMAGFASSNPYSTVGAMRGVMQIIGYEFPFIVSLLVPFMFVNTISPSVVNAYQATSGFPWIGVLFPFAAIAYFVSILAKTELPPFHVPDAHQEIVTGYMTEYSGFRLALLELVHMIKIFVLVSLGIAVFLGGSSAGLLGLGAFALKAVILLVVIALARVVFARVRIDHVVKVCWIFGAIALIDLARVLLF
ncbi:MAG: hypothetical protein DRO99_04860 [Candidatus Aenigmatarchaeota archaeon]|nr:MAG: hypothetical protein DRO99_04860 [Candidatus Aenigmarchaeota archaeon]